MTDTKNQIINSMCLTWRHDFDLDRRHDAFGYSGMTPDEREALRRQMGQLFDDHIAVLIAENEAANSRLHEVAIACATAEQEREQIRAEVEDLRKYAARWKWLESADAADWEHIGYQSHMNRHLHVEAMSKEKGNG